MDKNQRIGAFLVFGGLLFSLYFVWGAPANVDPSIKAAIFSALLMLSFVSLFLEHYFTRPADVLSAAIAIMLALAPMHTALAGTGIWYFLFFAYLMLCALLSLLGLLLADRQRPADAMPNKAAAVLTITANAIGNGRLLFTLFFLLCLFFYVDSQSSLFVVLATYAAFVVFADPQRAFVWIVARIAQPPVGELGHIIGVQSKNTFIAKLLPEHQPVRRFDFVQFKYSMGDPNKVFRGLIVDNYLLNEEQWIKILCSAEVDAMQATGGEQAELKDNAIYPVQIANPDQLLEKLVGVVMEGSTISRIRFEYAQRVQVAEGDLLGVKYKGRTILYQIVGGFTAVEQLQFKNESALVVGEAMQLGWWDNDRQTFCRFGWVPEINSPVLLVRPESTVVLGDDEVEIGYLPNTRLPVVFDVRSAVTHHLAVLGVTGSGKSVFTRDLIRKIASKGMKIICVDFTQEYQGRLADLNAMPLVDADRSATIFAAIDEMVGELVKFANQQDARRIERCQNTIKETFTECLNEFAQADEHVRIFELPDVSNSGGILEYTRWFFRSLFLLAKDGRFADANMCVVLEEAHTVVPEWNFAGTDDKRSQSVVNSISQIALQGRKYGIGFVVVAQRTANVSKTILTQCNSVVAFKQFDKTSSEFLSNYVGPSLVETLPTLQVRHAIVAGKALGSGTPVIFEVPQIVEADAVEP